MADYIPNPDADFDNWQANFVTYAVANAAALGLVMGDTLALTGAQADWNTAYAAALTAKTAAKAAVEAKNDRREDFETVIRGLVRLIQARPTTTDEQRVSLGITVPDQVQTTSGGAPASRPVGVVDTSQRLQHTIRFYDEATPTSRAKPAGALGCEIVVKIGDPPPVDASQCQFLALDTASPYVATYEGTDANKTAHYMLRWVSRTGDKGPWSETVSATIGG